MKTSTLCCVLTVFLSVTVVSVRCGTSPEEKPTFTTSDLNPTRAIKGKVARQKCKEYAKFAFDEVESPTGKITRLDRCARPPAVYIVGETAPAAIREFPHIALLGYGNTSDSLEYGCVGSLISEDYILTTAVCIQAKPSYALLGEVNLEDDDDAHPQLIPIASGGTITHPQYKYPHLYHDIALIRLGKRPKLGPEVRPACLHTGDPYPHGKAGLTATGWGHLDFGGDRNTVLTKADMKIIEFPRCGKVHRNNTRNLKEGIKNDQHICAGTILRGNDICEADGGSPLQVYRNEPYCTLDIVGMESFAKGCGLTGAPGVFTRVENYVDWIESIVWPGKTVD